ncbi:MAG: glycoside hydrolase family 99-like domain-containing protein [Pseudomonadota bacterium]
MTPGERRYYRLIRGSGMFDATYYAGAYPHIHPWFHKVPMRHYVLYGERRGYRPNPDFSPSAYLRYNPDVAQEGVPPFFHYIQKGQTEDRLTKELPVIKPMPRSNAAPLRIDRSARTAPFAIVVHVYYGDLWPEFRDTLNRVGIDFDLFVTVTYHGDETDDLVEEIRNDFPEAMVLPVENRGRDILPFFRLINSGALDEYDSVAKFHTKKSPHREDGEKWRRHLISGILPPDDLPAMVDAFLQDDKAAFWVADGQHYDDIRWWGTNQTTVRDLLRRLEIEITGDKLAFPAGSIYWMKPIIVGLLKSLHLTEEQFETESAQVDGTIAHAIERTMGFLAEASRMKIVQETELRAQIGRAPAPRPAPPVFVSAFYLPQFHPIPENDGWWGKGFTEWRGVVGAQPMFEGHAQPVLPTDLGFYDLRVTEVMGEQARLAHTAGIDAFCVYHYWFGGQRVLEQPLDRLLTQTEIEFPFYLCWANESWRRNWDGLSGEVLLEQSYADGFEAELVRDTLPYMRDPRYQRPDGARPRFVIYRPEDMPEPTAAVARMREEWRRQGIGEVELGAVRFHIEGETTAADDLFDFWIEMPPHGLVKERDYLYGGPKGNRMKRDMASGFEGLIYDYEGVMKNAMDPAYLRTLPENTICGVMPSWDNSARRGLNAHMSYGANPVRFGLWIEDALSKRLPTSYRQEMLVNAWNEWAEKAMLEPNTQYGDLHLRVMAKALGKVPH